MKRPSLSKVVTGGCVLAVAMSGAGNAQPQSPPPVKSESNSIEFAASDRVFEFGSGTERLNEMRARMADPQQRAKMHEDQRRGIVDSHYGVADALQLDAATFDKLMDVLTDQQMERSEHFYAMFADPGPAGDPNDRVRAEAKRVTEQINAMREVLGQEKLERYQKLSSSLGQRHQVRQFEERLAASDKLTGPQRERLVELLNDQLVSSIERQQLHSPLAAAMLSLPSIEELQRFSELQTITSNEEIWREMPESNRQLRERAAEFLTESQLATLAQLHAEQTATRQRQIEQMRVQAGLSSAIPEQAEVTEAPLATVDRDVKVSLKVAVDNESPRYLTATVSSGKSVSLKIADALFVEATPTVFDNNTYNLRVLYFETGVTGKRLIGNMGQSGLVVRASDNESSRLGGGSGSTVLSGSKGYAVELMSRVEAT
jgi:hypothetical protein